MTKDDKDLSELNAEHLAVVLLVIVPDTMQLCIIHSMGYGTKTFLIGSPVAEKVLGLVGDRDADIDQDPVVLSPSVFKYMKMLVPTEAQVDVALAAGNVTMKADELMQAVPVPAFVVYDGLDDGDLDLMELYPRLNLLDGLANWKVAANNLAAVAMVKLRSTDLKAFVADLQQRIPPMAKKWGKERFEKHFPGIRAAAASPNPLSPPNTQLTQSDQMLEFAQKLLELQSPQKTKEVEKNPESKWNMTRGMRCSQMMRTVFQPI